MKTIHFSSSFAINAVIIISSPRLGEENISRRLFDDLKTIQAATFEFHVERCIVENKQQLTELLWRLARYAKKYGLRPVIHFDMHGDKVRGLEISKSREFASWLELVGWLRKINKRTKNNLCVVAASCYGLYMIKPISILNAVPFYCLIAPEEEVKIGYIDEKMGGFYANLAQKENLEEALKVINDKFKVFHSERVFAITFGNYIKQQCKGTGKAKRINDLISNVFAMKLLPYTEKNVSLVRRLARDSIRPSEELFRRYADKFMIGKVPGVSYDDVVAMVEASILHNQ